MESAQISSDMVTGMRWRARNLALNLPTMSSQSGCVESGSPSRLRRRQCAFEMAAIQEISGEERVRPVVQWWRWGYWGRMLRMRAWEMLDGGFAGEIVGLVSYHCCFEVVCLASRNWEREEVLWGKRLRGMQVGCW